MRNRIRQIRLLAVCLSIGCLLQLTGCSLAGVTYRNYIQAVLDCSYHGETEAYCQLTDATEAAAQELFSQEVQALSEQMRSVYGVRTDMIKEKTIARYDALAEEILLQTKYTIREVQQSGDAYVVTLILMPVDIWEQSRTEIEDYYETVFMEKYRRAATKKRADVLEDVYARNVCYILERYASELTYKEPVQYDIHIGMEAYYPAGETWQDIDAILLDKTITDNKKSGQS